ncbi:MAG: hypothetical protein JEY99_19385 [Spirochaetales bacterium]|nr:hypothetical protein [Spirochaetales bacterium]
MGQNIVLGLGNNTDYEIVWDSSVLESLIIEYGISSSELSNINVISSIRDLVVSILDFINKGSGGERFVASPYIIEKFSDLFKKKITLGGTSIRAAIAMDRMGYSSALHMVTNNEHVQRLTPKGCDWICSNEGESSYPHLIIQFSKGIRIQAEDLDIVSENSNRIIYVNDLDNTFMNLSPELPALVSDARVFLISGFNAMRSSTLLAERLSDLKRTISALPDDSIVFYEDAYFHEPELIQLVHEELLDSINIYSMNEEELQAYLGRDISLIEPLDIYNALEELYIKISVPLLVIHTQCWALAYGTNAKEYKDALKGGITMATTRYRCGDDFTPEDYRDTELIPGNEKGTIFSLEIIRMASGKICCLPVPLISKKTVTTIGLGDAFVGGFLPALVKNK